MIIRLEEGKGRKSRVKSNTRSIRSKQYGVINGSKTRMNEEGGVNTRVNEEGGVNTRINEEGGVNTWMNEKG